MGHTNATFTSFEDAKAVDANGKPLFGLDVELAQKAARKAAANAGLERECKEFIEALVGKDLPPEGSLQEALKDGVVLCTVANAILPGVCPKPSESKMAFKQMENISHYCAACTKLDVPKFSLFQTVALYENQDMNAVLVNIVALGSAAQKVVGYAGPTLGAKLASANVRTFTEEQRIAGAATQTFLGKGSHGHASQAGMFDTSKEIVKSNAVASSEPSKLGMGSHGGATQAGMADTSRNIVKPGCG
mmetsp:Transcript_15045/g.40359  ORF Transcript_15045/g.40359 Transcript_15045/m.40359 type:complete len:247 (+) Transcript_15045:88-828(+)